MPPTFDNFILNLLYICQYQSFNEIIHYFKALTKNHRLIQNIFIRVFYYYSIIFLMYSFYVVVRVTK